MAEIFTFKPQKGLDARAQVKHFILFCRNKLTVWANHIDWEAIEWDLTPSIPRAGRRGKNALQWTKMSKTKRGRSSEPMAQPFADFARAFVRNYRAEEGVKSFVRFPLAFRVIEKALMERSPDGEVHAERIDSAVLDRCKEIIEERYAPDAQYDIVSTVIQIHRFLKENSMLNNPCDWDNRPAHRNRSAIGTDDEVRANRNKKLPSEAAYYALLEINAKAETGDLSARDQVITSNSMVCCANPDRSAETATMRWDLVREGSAIASKTRLLLAWYPVKGGAPTIKPIPERWEEVTRKSIERLQMLSAPAREMALWYELHPDQIYLPSEYEYLREREFLTALEIQALLGVSRDAIYQRYNRHLPNEYMKKMVKREPVPNWTKGGMTPYRYNFADFQHYVLSQLPMHFPFVNPEGRLKFSDMMNIYPIGLIDSRRPGASLANSSKVMFEWFDASALALALRKNRNNNIFTRHGYFEDEARTKPLGIKTHQLRHLNVTMAQQAGMSDVEKTKLRGSSDVAQTTTYEHLTSKERMEAIGLDPEKGMRQRDDGVLQMEPITELEIKKLRERGLLQLHENEYGLCAHPIEQEPCPRFLACLGCTEQLCKVGDEKKTQRIERTVQGAKDCLAHAEEMKREDKEDGYESSDADPWIRTQKATIEDGEALLAVLRDSNIENGVWVKRIGPNRYDPYLEMAKERAELTGTEEDKRLLELMTPLPLPKNPLLN